MPKELLKYKNYLLVLLALLVASYVIEPLVELQQGQQQSLALLKKKQSRTLSLMGNKQDFEKVNLQLLTYLTHSDDYLFKQKNTAEFKQTAQSQIETLLQSADCAIERIGFKGSQQILPNIEKWHMEIRYKGDVNCLINITRALETAKPYINIEEYNYNARNFDKKAQADFNARLIVTVWYKNNEKMKKVTK